VVKIGQLEEIVEDDPIERVNYLRDVDSQVDEKNGFPELYLWVFENDHKAAAIAQEELMKECERKGYGERALFSIQLAVEEALTNCLEHAYAREEGYTPHVDERGMPINYCPVTLACRFEEDLAVITVVDDGRAFDPREVPDPTDKDHLEVDHGRGILLMRAYMDSVNVHNRHTNPRYPEFGTAVVMEKKRAA